MNTIYDYIWAATTLLPSIGICILYISISYFVWKAACCIGRKKPDAS